MEQYAVKQEVDWYRDLVYMDAVNEEYDCVFVGEFECRQTDRRYAIVKSPEFVMTVFADYYTGQKISQDGILTGRIVPGCIVYNKKPKENWVILYLSKTKQEIVEYPKVFDYVGQARPYAHQYLEKPIGFLEKNNMNWMPYDKEKGYL